MSLPLLKASFTRNGVRKMKTFYAESDNELGKILRMLYPEFSIVTVNPSMNSEKKMIFHILVDMNDITFEFYKRRLATIYSE